VKISLENLRTVFFSFHVDALLRRSLLKISPRNQQRLFEKWEDSDFEKQAH